MSRRDKSDVHNHLSPSRKHSPLISPTDRKTDATSQAITAEKPSLVLIKKSVGRLILPLMEDQTG
jgi:hypothetical protein